MIDYTSSSLLSSRPTFFMEHCFTLRSYCVLICSFYKWYHILKNSVGTTLIKKFSILPWSEVSLTLLKLQWIEYFKQVSFP